MTLIKVLGGKTVVLPTKPETKPVMDLSGLLLLKLLRGR